MRRLGTAILLLTAAMAGCIGADTSEEIEGTDVPPGESPREVEIPQGMEMTGCSEQLGIFPMVSPGEAMAPLPEGFESEHLFYIFATHCEASAAAEGDAVTQLHGGLFVVPPDDLAREDAVAHALPFGAFVDHGNVTSVFDEWNMGAEEGDVTVETLAETPAARTGHALGSEGSFTVHMYSEALSPGEGEPGVVRFFGIDDGEVANAVDMTWTEASVLQGQATYAFDGQTSPFPPPAEPGIVEHWWGDDYAFEFTYVPSEALGS